MLAADARLGVSPDVPLKISDTQLADSDSLVGAVVCRPDEVTEIPDCRICVKIPCADGTFRRLIDYSSAGKTYDERSAMAAWLTK